MSGLSRQYSATRLKLQEIYCNKQYFNAQHSNTEFDKYDKTWLQVKEYHLLGCDTVQSDKQVQFEKKVVLSSARQKTHLHISSTTKMKRIGSSKLVPFYQTEWCHNSKESDPHGHCFLRGNRPHLFIYSSYTAQIHEGKKTSWIQSMSRQHIHMFITVYNKKSHTYNGVNIHLVPSPI